MQHSCHGSTTCKKAIGFPIHDAVKKLRGKVGTKVLISVQRKGLSVLKDIIIIREVINVKSVKSRYLGDGFAYARISQFMETTTRDLKRALKSIKKHSRLSELKGLILDLRNNPGGLLNQAISVSDLFLKDGVVVYTEGRVKDQKQKFYAKDNGDEPTYPIVVLVNGGSASASEIVSGAFKDHGRALIVGTQTFGKGSVQTITPLENGGAVTLTTALYFTKSGNSIQAKGVSPDIEVEYIPYTQEKIIEEESKKGIKLREKDLPGAIKNPSFNNEANPMKKLNKTPTSKIEAERIDPETVDIKEWLKKDNQFHRALDLLKSFKVFQVKNLVG